ncbi:MULTISPECIES: FAD binding domain-containing protein [Rhizobium]|uniref:Xanthine dehydrogenase family protein subunit M n=1 Tax=Rhizobium rhododendri TaxID=2506430 RepID=A0ABY8IF24_9HYPH|nr:MULTISPECIES: xanthine dehydrogenase family protein subunit M [Rhizobium]MBZ5758982.1 xanthine dehydrogenase family protein subunit M [Rhizobium sp. VS19-DR96]MBZ5764188.1 xanthine dehydrogenase family protein subunit M [Rhizobium sp. VS19-DR129.2]MBZ5771731.1 xanthine dehydrogenase family protein subunit M [Rhizobium sp. VS19-DRK62.2]MBZ5783582.1 xanthine dehydrogenase family protein subunit M [Rhizobium sp. VS19-DR121]MBZ5801744.1 xanthine dehydrogenase family protein subunit M [Rhizobium
MNRFEYIKPANVSEAVAALASNAGAQVIAGGTNIVDLMKYDVVAPSVLVDINGLQLKDIEALPDGGYRIGALASNSDIAYHEGIQRDYPLLSSAILAGASPQLRNAATAGGNLLQRTRCYYFYDPSTPCNKREPGSGCSAIGGLNRIHAILGTSDSCIATHPSDMCVGLAALDAVVEVTGPDGERTIEFADFHRLPGDMPEKDNTLMHGEIVTGIRIDGKPSTTHHTYLKLRDRLSYAFALVSVAVSLDMDGGVVSGARIALGGVAHKPWRDRQAEAALIGRQPSEADFRAFAATLLAPAKGQGSNDFKIPLAEKAILRALRQAVAGTPQVQSVKAIA